jgi:hypothetical protein
MYEYIARPVYYVGVHLLYASIALYRLIVRALGIAALAILLTANAEAQVRQSPGIFFLTSNASQMEKVQEHPVEVRFVKSPYADYLFYLLYRSTRQFPQLETALPLGKIPSLDQLISLPEQAASAQIKSYAELYPLVKQYRRLKTGVVPVSEGRGKGFRKLVYSDEMPPYQELNEIVHQGKASYPLFQQFWEQNIAPAEQQQIDVWKHQLIECDPLKKLQEMERLSFPFSKLDVGAIALHLSGSGNTDPAGVYTVLLKKPNLAWVLGHEATHLMVDQYAGHHWHLNPLADQAIALVKQHGGAATDIEESLALFMQVKVPQACGYTEASRHMSDKFPANTTTGAILRSLESGWDDYQANHSQDIIDYLLRRTIAAFAASPK